jgi:hypothetical protein
MKSEEFIFRFLQNSLADQTKISDILFIPSAPNGAPVGSTDDREPGMTYVLFLLDTVPESAVTEPEDIPQNAVARRFQAPAKAVAQSKPLALHTGFFRYCDCFRVSPINIH